MLDTLFAAPVSIEVATDRDYDAPLEAVESAAAATMVEHRRREFAAGRAVARRALRAAGFAPVAIPVGPRREPLWPTGIIGSITHCRDFCAAAVALRGALASLGLDAEPLAPLDPELMESVLQVEELKGLRSLPVPHGTWSMAAFVAKESIFKALYPVLHQEIPFHAVRLRTGTWPQLIAEPTDFTDPAVAARLPRLQLRLAVTSSLVIAGASLLAD